MVSPLRSAALVGALAVHGAALAAVHAAMIQIAAREQLSLSQPPRIVVNAPAAADRRIVARQSCGDPRRS